MLTIDCLRESPIGPIWVAQSDAGLVAIYIGAHEARLREIIARLTKADIRRDPGRVQPALAQLHEYLHRQRQSFTLPIDNSILTPFQQEVLSLVQQIPYGQVRTYGDIARALGKPGASRAVGRANATNPLPIVIPCHRVLGSDGKLHGYGGGAGLETKAWLLRLEGSRLI
ncbi:MAG: methylated-DNA--[protein]-cysteine S-methyltransferase [Anaerolineales bacterium]|nr:methylated-DNA--[protein]-cysteine S-methyltransferase [Anaerolineales bacterium]